MPVNWYAALVLIVLVGIASVFLARHDYDKTPASVPPTVGQTWHAALSVDICGKVQVALTTTGSGVLLIAPKTNSEAGHNATLGNFAKANVGLVLSDSSLQYPGGTLYKNGAKCKSGTPDAGQTGVVRVRSWTLSTASQKSGSQVKLLGGHYSSKPADLRFKNGQLITVGFGPSAKALPKVPGTTELALLQAINGTQAPVTTTTTAATTTTTTTAGSTASTTTSTAPAGSTTTTTTAKSG
jgi:hypothetical protein